MIYYHPLESKLHEVSSFAVLLTNISPPYSGHLFILIEMNESVWALVIL